MPFWAPDCSNTDAYSAAFAGKRGGTRIGPPLICGCKPAGGAGIGDGAGGADGSVIPSNLGRGPAKKQSAPNPSSKY
jgi:hypothetical protein